MDKNICPLSPSQKCKIRGNCCMENLAILQYSLSTHTCLDFVEIVIWIYDTFDNNFNNNHNLATYLKEIFGGVLINISLMASQ